MEAHTNDAGNSKRILGSDGRHVFIVIPAGFLLLSALCAITGVPPQLSMFVAFTVILLLVDLCLELSDGTSGSSKAHWMVGLYAFCMELVCRLLDRRSSHSEFIQTPTLPTASGYPRDFSVGRNPWSSKADFEDSVPSVTPSTARDERPGSSDPNARIPSGAAITMCIEKSKRSDASSMAPPAPVESRNVYLNSSGPMEVTIIQLKELLAQTLTEKVRGRISAFDEWCEKNDLAFLSSDSYLHRPIGEVILKKYAHLVQHGATYCTGMDLLRKLLATCPSQSDPNFLMLMTRQWLEEMLRIEDTFTLDNAKLRESEWKQRRAHVKAVIERFAFDNTFHRFSAKLPSIETARVCPSDCEVFLHLIMKTFPGLKKHFRFGHQSLFSTEKYTKLGERFAFFYSADGEKATCFIQRVFPEGGTERQHPRTSFERQFPVPEDTHKLRIVPSSTTSGFFHAILIWLDCMWNMYVNETTDKLALENFEMSGLGALLRPW